MAIFNSYVKLPEGISGSRRPLRHFATFFGLRGGGFTCYELDHFYRVFQRFDRDNSDSMSCSELANALTWLGFPYGPEKLQVGDADWLGIDIDTLNQEIEMRERKGYIYT